MAIEKHLTERYGSPEGAAAYRRKYRKSVSRRLSNRRELALVDQVLTAIGARDRFLDCPCGAGRLTPTLLRHATHVTAADASAAMVEQAKGALHAETAEGRVDFAVASADALPFADDTFDVAVCHRLIHHVEDEASRARIFCELGRVAREYVVVSFNDATTFKMRWQMRRGRKRRRIAWTPAAFAAEAAAQGLERAGEVRRLNGLFSLVAVIPFRVRGT